MNATLKKPAVVEIPATIAQMAKINQLIAEQHPTMKRMQQACRLVPDLLKSDLSKVNRYDFCRHIGRKLPFKIHTISDIELTVQHGSFYPKLVEFYRNGFIANKDWLEYLARKIREHTEHLPKLSGTATGKFLVVGCCDPQKLESFDLRPANLYEFLAFAPKVNCISPLSYVAGKCGNGWLWYSMDRKGVLKLVSDAFPDDRAYESFRFGTLDMPTLVHRIAK